MTILEAVQAVDAVLDDPCTYAQKVRWLSELDGQIFRRLHLTHGEQAGEPHYDENTDPQTELLVSAPYESLYSAYLAGRILECMGQRERSEYARADFQRRLDAFASDYHRSHTPRRSACGTREDMAGECVENDR